MTDPDEAWRQFCVQLQATGESISSDSWPREARDRAEGYRHLARLTVMALQSYLEFGDVDFPAFHRYDDDVVKWGGPNVDNHYLRARVDPDGVYRIDADVRGVRDLIVSIHEGDMQLGQLGVFCERQLRDLDADPDGQLAIIVGGPPAGTNWLPLDPQATLIVIRVYVADWEHDEPGTFDIQRLDRPQPSPPPLEPGAVAAGLSDAAAWVDRSVHYWRDYLEQSPVRALINRLSPPRPVPGGSDRIRYGAGWWELDGTEALVIEFDDPACEYWSLQLYSTPWFESLDVRNRLNSYTGASARVDADGQYRFVLSGTDPGAANWLDTEGRRTGMISYRFIGAPAAPTPRATVVALADIAAPVDPRTRAAQIDARRRGIARRFRR